MNKFTYHWAGYLPFISVWLSYGLLLPENGLADPVYTSAPDGYTVNGTDVKGSGVNTTSAYFLDTASTAYTINIKNGANLGNTTGLGNGNELELTKGTVISHGTLVANTVGDANAIQFNGQGGVVNNFGTIMASDNGISLAGGGSVTNSGLISGDDSAAVYSDTDLIGTTTPLERLTITNTGSLLSSTDDGIDSFEFNADSTGRAGEVINLSNANVITGQVNGIDIDSGNIDGSTSAFNTLHVTNSGSITGTTNEGIELDDFFNTNNDGPAANLVSVNNSGSITAGSDGLDLEMENENNNGHTLDQITVQNSGSITSGDEGIEIDAGNYENSGRGRNFLNLTSTGTIDSTENAVDVELYNESGGGNGLNVINLTNKGTITSSIDGIEFGAIYNDGDTGNGTNHFTLVNSGSITATHYPLYVEVYNEEDTGNGVTTVSIVNTGSMVSNDYYGLTVYEGGNYDESGTGVSTVNILNTGSVSADNTAVYLYEGNQAVGGNGLSTIRLVNSGTITSTIGEGIFDESFNENNGGNATTLLTVSNLSNGSITSSGEGVDMDAQNRNNAGTHTDSSVAVLENAGSIHSNEDTGASVTAGNLGSAGNSHSAITIINTGQIEGATSGVGALLSDLDIAGKGSSTINLVNSGVIEGGTADGVSLQNEDDASASSAKGSITVRNNYFISGEADGVFISNNQTSAGYTATVINSGFIVGQTYGIEMATNNARVVALGGAIGGGTDSIILEGTNSSVTIQGRLSMEGAIEGNDLAGNVLNFHLAGLTPGEIAEAKAAVAAAGTGPGGFDVQGTDYTFDGFQTVHFSGVSFEQSVDPGLHQLAVLVDHNEPNFGALDTVYVAGFANPEAALDNLSGRQFLNAFREIGLSNATAMSALADNRAFALRSGTAGLDFTGLNVNSATMIASLGGTQGVLNRLGSASEEGTTMSDSKDEKTMIQSPSAPRWGAWASGTVTIADDSSSNDLGYNSTSGSPAIGVDYRLCPGLVAGALFNYTTGDVDFDGGSHLNTDTELGALYLDWSHDHWYVNGLAGYGQTSYNQDREALDGSHAYASPDGTEVLATVAGGYDFHVRGWTVSPEAGFQYTHLSKEGFTETGSGQLNLQVGSEDVDSLRSKLGFHATHLFAWKGLKLNPTIDAAWYHECLDDTTGVSNNLPGSGFGSFQIDTSSQGRDFALVGAGLTAMPVKWNDAVSFFVNYDAQVGQNDFIAHTVDGGVRVGF